MGNLTDHIKELEEAIEGEVKELEEGEELEDSSTDSKEEEGLNEEEGIDEEEGGGDHEEEKEEEDQEEEEDLEKLGDKKGKAFAKLRKEKKEAERLAREREAELDRLMQEIKLKEAEQSGFQKALEVKKEDIEEDIEPDELLDPDAHKDWQIRQLKNQQEKILSQQAENAAYLRKMKDQETIRKIESSYQSSNPDINLSEAKEFIKAREREVIKLQYPQATDQEIANHFEEYEINLYRNHLQNGQNPAEVIAKMAKVYGYESTKEEGTSLKKKKSLKKVIKNQDISSSLLGGSDNSGDHDLNAKTLVDMSIHKLASMNPKVLERVIRQGS